MSDTLAVIVCLVLGYVVGLVHSAIGRRGRDASLADMMELLAKHGDIERIRSSTARFVKVLRNQE